MDITEKNIYLIEKEESEEITVTSVIAKIINLAFWLGSLIPVLILIVAGLFGLISVFIDDHSAVPLIACIPLSILLMPWIPEKILKKRMSLPLRFIYSWVLFAIVKLCVFYVGDSLQSLL